MAFGGLFFALKTPLNKLWWIQKLSYPPHFIHGKRWCIQKNPILTHLLNEHFFWDTLYMTYLKSKKNWFFTMILGVEQGVVLTLPPT